MTATGATAVGNLFATERWTSLRPNGILDTHNARERIGPGPWYNAKRQLVARDVADLHRDLERVCPRRPPSVHWIELHVPTRSHRPARYPLVGYSTRLRRAYYTSTRAIGAVNRPRLIRCLHFVTMAGEDAT